MDFEFIVPPPPPWSQIAEKPDELEIRIPSRFTFSHGFALFFYVFWTLGWLLLTELMPTSPDARDLPLEPPRWLIFLAVTPMPMLALWGVGGEEILRIGENEAVIELRYFGVTVDTKRYPASVMASLHVAPDNSMDYMPYFIYYAGGMRPLPMALTQGYMRTYFGSGVDEAEALIIVERAKEFMRRMAKREGR